MILLSHRNRNSHHFALLTVFWYRDLSHIQSVYSSADQKRLFLFMAAEYIWSSVIMAMFYLFDHLWIARTGSSHLSWTTYPQQNDVWESLHTFKVFWLFGAFLEPSFIIWREEEADLCTGASTQQQNQKTNTQKQYRSWWQTTGRALN